MNYGKLLLVAGCYFLLVACQVANPTLSAEQIKNTNTLLEEYNSPPAEQLATLHELSVNKICKAYARNKTAADEMFGNKWLKVRGTLVYGPTNEGFQGLNMYYVGLEGGGKTMAFIFMGTKQKEELQALEIGKSLVIAGIYTPGEKYLPKLLGCVLISVE